MLRQDKSGNMLNLWKAVTAAHLLCDSRLGTVPLREVYRKGKQISGCQGLGVGGEAGPRKWEMWSLSPSALSILNLEHIW